MFSSDEIVINHRLDEGVFSFIKNDVVLCALFFILLKEASEIASFIQEENFDHPLHWQQGLDELSHQECVLWKPFEVLVVSFWSIVDYLLSKMVEALDDDLHLLSILLLKNNFPVLKSVSFRNDILLRLIALENLFQNTLSTFLFIILLLYHHKELIGAVV